MSGRLHVPAVYSRLIISNFHWKWSRLRERRKYIFFAVAGNRCKVSSLPSPYHSHHPVYAVVWNVIGTENIVKRTLATIIVGIQVRGELLETTVEKVEWSCYRPGVARRVATGIALHFHDRGSRRGWVVSSTPRPHFTPGKDPVPILQEAGCAPGQVWTGGKSRPHRDWIPDRPARSQSLYRLSYLAHINNVINLKFKSEKTLDK